VSTVSKEKLTLADTHSAKKRRRLDKQKDDMKREMKLQQAAAEARVYVGFQSAPKSHYMYNVPLIPPVSSLSLSSLKDAKLFWNVKRLLFEAAEMWFIKGLFQMSQIR